MTSILQLRCGQKDVLIMNVIYDKKNYIVTSLKKVGYDDMSSFQHKKLVVQHN